MLEREGVEEGFEKIGKKTNRWMIYIGELQELELHFTEHGVYFEFALQPGRLMEAAAHVWKIR